MGCWIRIFDLHDVMTRQPYRHVCEGRGEEKLNRCGDERDEKSNRNNIDSPICRSSAFQRIIIFCMINKEHLNPIRCTIHTNFYSKDCLTKNFTSHFMPRYVDRARISHDIICSRNINFDP